MPQISDSRSIRGSGTYARFLIFSALVMAEIINILQKAIFQYSGQEAI